MFKNPIVKNVLMVAALAGLGFVLLNITFISYALFGNAIRKIVMIFIVEEDLMTGYRGFAPLIHISFLIVISLISWLVFRLKLPVFWKAVYMSVPVAVGLATLGIFLYSWPLAVYFVGALSCLGVLYYFYRTRQPWLYYYALILISLALAIFTLLGGEI